MPGGRIPGSNVGVAVGVCVGSNVGDSLGAYVGANVGENVGDEDAHTPPGQHALLCAVAQRENGDGARVGEWDGSRDGKPVPECCENDGVSVGVMVGTIVGEAVGRPNLHGALPEKRQNGDASTPGSVQSRSPVEPPHLAHVDEQHPWPDSSAFAPIERHHALSNRLAWFCNPGDSVGESDGL